MKYKILHNPTTHNIKNYPIEEAKLDQDGNMYIGEDNTYAKTGRTLEWSIGAGETLELPDYVAEYLAHIYGFMELRDTVAVNSEPIKVIDYEDKAETPPTNLSCKKCGQPFKEARGLALHIAAKHPELL